MSLFDFSSFCMIIIFAQLTESRVLILHEYDDKPLVFGQVDRPIAKEEKHKYQVISSNNKPKRAHSKKTVLQYGRHIYHLNDFVDLKDLRSKMTQLKPDSVSYDYVDIDNLFRSSDSAKQSVGDYLVDLFIFFNKPVQVCDGDQFNEDLRKFSKHKHDDDDDDDRKHKNKRMQFGRMKRFQVVNNRHETKKPQSDSSEEHHEKKKRKASRKKKKKQSSESAESKSNESGSVEKSSGSHKKKKKKNEPRKSSEESDEIEIKPWKKHNDDAFDDVSVEKWNNHDKDSKSNEDFHKKKENVKAKYYGKLDETKRKTMADDDDFFMQGNKIFNTKEKKFKKKHYDFDKRRRLEDFLPKRYHWKPSEIHDLGYFWFNGPKGLYSSPRVLSK